MIIVRNMTKVVQKQNMSYAMWFWKTDFQLPCFFIFLPDQDFQKILIHENPVDWFFFYPLLGYPTARYKPSKNG